MQTVNFKPKVYNESEQKWSIQTLRPKGLTNSKHNNSEKQLGISKNSCTDRNAVQTQDLKKKRTQIRQQVRERLNRVKKTTQRQQKSRSRSRSSSSYCQAGCLRRSVKTNKKTANHSTNNQKPQQQTNKTKLFETIQKFYTNLSSLPLDILITHTDPKSWLNQQHEICRQLQIKLSKVRLEVNGNEKQNYNRENVDNGDRKGIEEEIRDQRLKYYSSMLNAIDGVLENIEKNMGLLEQLHRQQLNRYNSNTTINSSATGSQQKASFQNSSPAQISNFPSSQSSSPTPNRKPQPYFQPYSRLHQFTNEQSQYQIQANKSHQNVQIIGKYPQKQNRRGRDNSTRQTSKDIGNQAPMQVANSVHQDDVYQQMLGKLNQNLCKLINVKKNANQTTNDGNNAKDQGFAKSAIPQQKHFQNITHLLSTCRSQQSPQNLQKKSCSKMTQKHNKVQKFNNSTDLTNKAKTNNFVKFDLSSPGQSQSLNHIWEESSGKSRKSSEEKRTKRIGGEQVEVQQDMESVSELFAMSVVNCGKSDMQKVKNLFKRFASTLKPSHPPPPLPLPQPTLISNPNLKPLLSQISSLKHELQQKNRSIESLLRNQQQHQQIIQLYKKSQISHKSNVSYANQRIKNLQALVQKYQKQVQKYQNMDTEMRQSVNKNIEIIGVLMKEKKVLEGRVEKLVGENNQLRQQIGEMKVCWGQEIKKIKKNQNIIKQKMEIYKQKYYQMLHQTELKKMVMTNTYAGKASKSKQIWDILAEHRKNLHTIDQDKQQKQLNPNSNRDRSPKQQRIKKYIHKNFKSESQQDSSNQQATSSLAINYKSTKDKKSRLITQQNNRYNSSHSYRSEHNCSNFQKIL